VFRYNLFDDTIDKLLLCERPSIENLYFDDRMLLHSSLQSCGTVHNLLDRIVLYDLMPHYNLFDDKLYIRSLSLQLFRYGILNTVMADVNLLIQSLLYYDQMLMAPSRWKYGKLNILLIFLLNCDLDLLQHCIHFDGIQHIDFPLLYNFHYGSLRSH